MSGVPPKPTKPFLIFPLKFQAFVLLFTNALLTFIALILFGGHVSKYKNLELEQKLIALTTNATAIFVLCLVACIALYKKYPYIYCTAFISLISTFLFKVYVWYTDLGDLRNKSELLAKSNFNLGINILLILISPYFFFVHWNVFKTLEYEVLKKNMSGQDQSEPIQVIEELPNIEN